MKRIIFAIVLFASFFGCGEEKLPSVEYDSIKQYDKVGISFDYPGNWEVANKQVEDDLYIDITMENGPLLKISVWQIDDEVSLREYAEHVRSLYEEGLFQTKEIVEMERDSFTPPIKGLKFGVSKGQSSLVECYTSKYDNKVIYFLGVTSESQYFGARKSFDLILDSFEFKDQVEAGPTEL